MVKTREKKPLAVEFEGVMGSYVQMQTGLYTSSWVAGASLGELT